MKWLGFLFGVLLGVLQYAIPSQAAVIETPSIRITGQSSAKTFTPNGDGQDETLDIFVTTSRATEVSLTVRNTQNQVIRRLLTNEPSSTLIISEWDGISDGRSPAPDGQYRIDIEIYDGDEVVDTSSIDTAIRRGDVGRIELEEHEDLHGIVEVIYVPIANYGAYSVRIFGDKLVQLGGADEPDEDGRWRVSIDTNKIADGEHELVARVYWRDRFDQRRRNLTATIPFSVDNDANTLVRLLQAPESRAFTPNGDGHEDQLDLRFILSEPTTVQLIVLDSGGFSVRTVLPGVPKRTKVLAVWDGRDDLGQVVPDGRYTLLLVAADAHGFIVQSRVPTEVVARHPGDVTFPLDQSVVSGEQVFQFSPIPEFPLTGVRFYTTSSRSLGVTNVMSEDGQWRVAALTTTRTEGTYDLWARLYWTDSFGIRHFQHSAVSEITIDNTLPTAELEVAEDLGEAEIVLNVDDPNNRTITYKIDFGDETEPVTGSIQAPYDTIVVLHDYLDRGAFAVAAAVVKEGGNSAEALTDVIVAEPALGPRYVLSGPSVARPGEPFVVEATITNQSSTTAVSEISSEIVPDGFCLAPGSSTRVTAGQIAPGDSFVARWAMYPDSQSVASELQSLESIEVRTHVGGKQLLDSIIEPLPPRPAVPLRVQPRNDLGARSAVVSWDAATGDVASYSVYFVADHDPCGPAVLYSTVDGERTSLSVPTDDRILAHHVMVVTHLADGSTKHRHTQSDGPALFVEPELADDAAEVRSGEAVMVDVLRNDNNFEGDLDRSSVVIESVRGPGTARVLDGAVLVRTDAATVNDKVVTDEVVVMYSACNQHRACDSAILRVSIRSGSVPGPTTTPEPEPTTTPEPEPVPVPELPPEEQPIPEPSPEPEPEQTPVPEQTPEPEPEPTPEPCLDHRISFDIGSGLSNREGRSQSSLSPVDLDCQHYTITLISIDTSHAAGYQVDQRHEQWALEGLDKSGSVVFRSPATLDLPEEHTSVATNVGTFDLSGVVAFRAVHVQVGASVNSVHEAVLVLTPVS